MESYVFATEVLALAATLAAFVCKKSKADKVALLALILVLLGFLSRFLMDSAVDTVTRWIQRLQPRTWGIGSDYLHGCFLVIVGLIALLRYAFVDTRVVKPLKRNYTPDYVPESMKPGSSFQLNADNPPFQCEVHGSVDGVDYYPLGQAFWVDQGLVTAAHVIYDVQFVYLARGEAQIEVNKEDFQLLDGDLALYKITQKETQALKMSKGKLSVMAVGEASGLMAQVVAYGQRSFGFIQPYGQFGYCSYSGSTLKGFSGAPYYLNKTIFGMHLGGSVDNLGYEAAYILSVLRPSKTIVKSQEASDDWLIDQAARTTSFDYERNPYDPDEYRVKLNGRYHMVEGDVLEKMLRCGKGKVSKRDVAYDCESSPPPSKAEDLPLAPRGALDYDQGNLIRAPAVVAGARGVEQVLPAAPRSDLQTSPQTASRSPQHSENSPMVSPESMPVPQRKVSRSTAKNRRRRSQNQALTKRVEELSRLVEATMHGQRT